MTDKPTLKQLRDELSKFDNDAYKYSLRHAINHEHKSLRAYLIELIKWGYMAETMKIEIENKNKANKKINMINDIKT